MVLTGIHDTANSGDLGASPSPDRVLRLSLALASASTPAEVSDAIMGGSRSAFPDSVGAIIARRTEEGSDLEIFAVSELPGEVFEAWQRFPISSDAPLAESARTAQVISLESPQAWLRRYPRLVSILDQTGHKAQLVAPLIVAGRTTGSLGIAFDQPRTFDTDDIRTITTIAIQCAIALDRARLFDRERAAREAAESANQTKSGFMASLSHELRTPLNAIAGYVQLLEMGVHGSVNQEQANALQRIGSIQHHINGLIDSVLEFSRIEAGAIHYEMRPVNLETCIGECENLVAPQMTARKIGFRRTGRLEISLVADEDKLRQILVNLLMNAIKYSEPGGSVTLAVEADSSRLYISVHDTGKGIDPSKLDLIFQPFTRLESGGSVREGVGLGLPISRSLARGMSGDLIAEGNPDGGSTFILSLPLAAS